MVTGNNGNQIIFIMIWKTLIEYYQVPNFTIVAEAILNPLAARDEISRPENVTFL